VVYPSALQPYESPAAYRQKVECRNTWYRQLIIDLASIWFRQLGINWYQLGINLKSCAMHYLLSDRPSACAAALHSQLTKPYMPRSVVDPLGSHVSPSWANTDPGISERSIRVSCVWPGYRQSIYWQVPDCPCRSTETMRAWLCTHSIGAALMTIWRIGK
jgi:hypothetical protein